MSDSILIDIAEAVKDEINSAGFGRDFKAERSYADWDVKLEDVDVLRVDVVPVRCDPRQASRGLIEYECAVDIGIRKRFGSSTTETATGRIQQDRIDELMELSQRISDYFLPSQAVSGQDGHPLTDVPEACWLQTENRAAFVPKHIREARQFTSIFRVTFLADRTPVTP